MRSLESRQDGVMLKALQVLENLVVMKSQRVRGTTH